MRKEQYKDKLDPKSAAQGIHLAYKNSVSLLDDAELLFANQRFERCAALSILAIEESGKASIIRAILLTDDSKELKKEWQKYRKHTEKNLSWILPELVIKGARSLEDLRPIFDINSNHGQTLDNLKQLSFYTDIFSLKKWSIPSDVIDESLAKSILDIAKVLVNKNRTSMTTEKELELWVKHLKPVWKQDMLKMKQALINCYDEAESLGIIDEGKAKEMTNFLK